MGKLFEELKRRKVFRVAAVYAVVAWVLIQVADVVLPTFEAPAWVNQTLIFLFILGFPIAVILAWAYEVKPGGIQADSGVARTAPAPANQWLVYATFLLVLIVAGFQLADRFVFAPSDEPAVAVVNPSPPDSAGTPIRRWSMNLGVTSPRGGSQVSADVALSKDGRQLLFSLRRPHSPQQIFVQQLDQLQPRLIANSEQGDFAVFSPDNAWIAFNSGRELQKVSIRGGQPQTLADSIAFGTAPFWAEDDRLFYAGGDNPGSRRLMQVDANGGTPVPVEMVDYDAGFDYAWPYVLPDGETLLYTRSVGGFENTVSEVLLLNLTSGVSDLLLANAYNARYAPSGHILFIREESLWAVAFDAESRERTGPEVPVIQGIQTSPLYGSAIYDFSDDGLLVYLPGGDTIDARENSRSLVWVDRSGNETPLLGLGNYFFSSLSPNGQTVALHIRGNNFDIWTYDLTRNTLSRLTFDTARDSVPRWTPDGERIVFTSDRGESGGSGLWWRAADGTGQAEPLITGLAGTLRPSSFTPDGAQLVYSFEDDLYLLPMDDNADPIPLIQTAGIIEQRAAISPNGRFIAYESDETGRDEIYVRPFPEVDSGKWQISNQGGISPTWHANGRELIFQNPLGEGYAQQGEFESEFWSASVETESGFQHQEPTLLFSGSYYSNGAHISSDGSKFLLLKIETQQSVLEQTQLVVVENWFAELEELAPRFQD